MPSGGVPTLFAAGGPGPAMVEIGALLLGLAVLARLAHRAKLSPIPLYLLAGLLIGEGKIVGLTSSDNEFLEVAASVGVVLLLLLLGLEYTNEELVSNLRTSARAGVVDLANALPGVGFALLAGWSFPAVVAMGGITYISSSGIIAKTLGDLDRLGNRETPTILSVLVIEDLVMALYLPLLVGLTLGQSAAVTGVATGAAIAAVFVILVAALKLSSPISRAVFSHSDEVLLFSILGLGLLIAGFAEEINVSGAVGAFLVGIAISGAAAHQASNLLLPLRDLFAAIFFIYFTYLINPIDLLGALAPAAALAVVSAGVKTTTGWWAAGRAGVGRRGRLRAGLTLVARGEFSIVIAGIAVTGGIEGDLGSVAAAYVLLLAVAGPLLARFGEPIVDRIAPRLLQAPLPPPKPEASAPPA